MSKGGGIVIVGVIILVLVSFMWCLFGIDGIFVVLGISVLGVGVVGWWDDQCGFCIWNKFLIEFVVGVIVVWLIDLFCEF